MNTHSTRGDSRPTMPLVLRDPASLGPAEREARRARLDGDAVSGHRRFASRRSTGSAAATSVRP